MALGDEFMQPNAPKNTTASIEDVVQCAGHTPLGSNKLLTWHMLLCVILPSNINLFHQKTNIFPDCLYVFVYTGKKRHILQFSTTRKKYTII